MTIHVSKLKGLEYLVNGKVVTTYGNVVEPQGVLINEEPKALADFVKATETLKIRSTIRSI